MRVVLEEVARTEPRDVNQTMAYQMTEIPTRAGGPVLKALAHLLPLPDAVSTAPRAPHGSVLVQIGQKGAVTPRLSAQHRHLRRIKAVDTAAGEKRLHVLLAPAGRDVTAVVDEIASEHGFPPEVVAVDVPECEPRTRDELEHLRALWPVHFRPPVPPPPIDDDSNAERLRPWVAQLLEHAHVAAGLAVPPGDTPRLHASFADRNGPNAALLVDPERQALVCKTSAPARAPAQRWGPHLNPLRHAAMEAAANLGRRLTSSHKRYRQGQSGEAAPQPAAFCPEEGQYLATGMHLLVVREPCPMYVVLQGWWRGGPNLVLCRRGVPPGALAHSPLYAGVQWRSCTAVSPASCTWFPAPVAGSGPPAASTTSRA